MRQDRKLGVYGGTKQYTWEKYNTISTTTYTWNKYNANSTTTYSWDRYKTYITPGAESHVSDIGTSYGNINNFYSDATNTLVYASSISIDSNNQGILTFNNPIAASENTALAQYCKNCDYNGIASFLKDKYWLCFNGWTTPKELVTKGDSYLRMWYQGGGFTNVFYSMFDTFEGYSDFSFYHVRYPNWIASQGTYDGTVTSTSSSAYPSNGHSGQDGTYVPKYWYVSTGSSTSYSKGSTSYGQVSSTSSSAYPNGGAQSGYWYSDRTSTTTYSKGTTSYGQVKNKDENAYPSNGRHTDGYWYVLQS